MDDENDPLNYAGTKEAVFYEFCHFLDELFHLLNLDSVPVIDKYFARFCNWSHRKG